MASCRVTLQDGELPRGDVIHRFRVISGARGILGVSNITVMLVVVLRAVAALPARAPRRIV